MLITALVVSFCKDGGGNVNVKLWFFLMYVRCEVLCGSAAADNVISININLLAPELYIFLIIAHLYIKCE